MLGRSEQSQRIPILFGKPSFFLKSFTHALFPLFPHVPWKLSSTLHPNFFFASTSTALYQPQKIIKLKICLDHQWITQKIPLTLFRTRNVRTQETINITLYLMAENDEQFLNTKKKIVCLTLIGKQHFSLPNKYTRQRIKIDIKINSEKV